MARPGYKALLRHEERIILLRDERPERPRTLHRAPRIARIRRSVRSKGEIVGAAALEHPRALDKPDEPWVLFRVEFYEADCRAGRLCAKRVLGIKLHAPDGLRLCAAAPVEVESVIIDKQGRILRMRHLRVGRERLLVERAKRPERTRGRISHAQRSA